MEGKRGCIHVFMCVCVFSSGCVEADQAKVQRKGVPGAEVGKSKGKLSHCLLSLFSFHTLSAMSG